MIVTHGSTLWGLKIIISIFLTRLNCFFFNFVLHLRDFPPSVRMSPVSCLFPRIRPFFVPLLLCLGFLAPGHVARAHQIKAVVSKAIFERDGSYLFGLSLEIQASEDPALNDTISPEQAALSYLKESITLHFDEVELLPEFSPLESIEQPNPFPGMDQVTHLYTETRGIVPRGAMNFMVRLSEETDVALVMAVIIDGVMQKRPHTLFAGEFSRPIDLGFIDQQVQEKDPFLAQEPPKFSLPGAKFFAEAAESPVVEDLLAGARELFANDAKRAVLALAVFLLATGFFRGMAQVVALVLGLVFGQMLALVGRVPEWPYLGELVLGASIVLMAWSNLAHPRVTAVRFALVVLVGMLVGFCTQTAEYSRLSGFLAGEVAALLAVFVVTWIVLGAFWKKKWYRSLLVIPASCILLGMGIYWTGMTLWEAGLLTWAERFV